VGDAYVVPVQEAVMRPRSRRARSAGTEAESDRYHLVAKALVDKRY
jgi:hypothetical protein